MHTLKKKLNGIREIWAFDNRWQLLLSRTLFTRDPISIYRIRGLEILVDHAGGDANGARNVIASPMYTDHLSRLPLHRPLRVLDIGANNGGFPLLLQLQQLEIAKVVCVELNPRTCVRLRFNLDRNVAGEHVVLNAALCGRSRIIEQSLGPGSVADSIYEPSHNADRLARVPGLTFDDIHASAFGTGEIVDLCKIDVEHAEYEVFSSPGHDLLSRCRYLLIEIHERAGCSPRDVVAAIVKCGFRELPVGSDPSVHCFENLSA
jgi:FkbM family methyltransferase